MAFIIGDAATNYCPHQDTSCSTTEATPPWRPTLRTTWTSRAGPTTRHSLPGSWPGLGWSWRTPGTTTPTLTMDTITAFKGTKALATLETVITPSVAEDIMDFTGIDMEAIEMDTAIEAKEMAPTQEAMTMAITLGVLTPTEGWGDGTTTTDLTISIIHLTVLSWVKVFLFQSKSEVYVNKIRHGTSFY